MASADDGTVAAHMNGVGEVLDALAQTSPGHAGTELRDAVRYFERATRSHVQARDPQTRALRRAARQIIHPPAVDGGTDGTTTAVVMDVLLLAAIAAARRHAARSHDQQDEATQLTAEHLRAAYDAAAQAPMAVMHANGQRLPAPLEHRHTQTVLAVLPSDTRPGRRPPRGGTGWPQRRRAPEAAGGRA
ncbi:hypothetical protein ACOT81_41675 [Streptomyces sp. WI04-05B]|uniref:hypothetical protein n=1 Tax=Streptomyces TaxID=1883 RepID=UPI0029A05573|nr:MULTISPECIES: hypothetical protein [unclassified Streptomyces]MDX2543563.1 hypothetical protein [Streptomyces sp. WI04-05B]MDX2582949.1 hypothetical protein [Streptomyces sp. WI04-05A]MDX3746736.1 hypothetical protein [Streptomyces sp. AK08-02]